MNCNELDNLLSIIYDNRENESIEIKQVLYQNEYTSHKLISINIENNMYIYFKLDTIKCVNQLIETSYIFNDKLYNKWFQVFSDYCNECSFIKIEEMFEQTLSKKPLSFLYRDYKLSKVINNENEKPE